MLIVLTMEYFLYVSKPTLGYLLGLYSSYHKIITPCYLATFSSKCWSVVGLYN